MTAVGVRPPLTDRLKAEALFTYKDQPDENLLSAAFRLYAGASSYFAGDDVTSDTHFIPWTLRCVVERSVYTERGGDCSPFKEGYSNTKTLLC